MTDIWGLALIGACITLALLPPRWDPAIRMREWLERRRHHD